jgi:hypothetical protein
VSRKLIDALTQTALDKTRPNAERWAAFSALRSLPDWKPSIDQMWDLALAGITNTNPEPRRVQTLETSAGGPPEGQVPKDLKWRDTAPEYPLSGHKDSWRRDAFIGGE